MTGIDQGALASAVAEWISPGVEILEPGPRARGLIPRAWWPVAESSDPEQRKRIALSLWNDDFLAMIPRYAEALRTMLVDVRVAKHDFYTTPTLDYVVRTAEGALRVWAGDDPRTFGGTAPALFEAIPDAVATFLRQVHAGYATLDGETAGLAAPTDMVTLAARWGSPDENEILDWDEDASFPGSQRLLLLTSDGDDTALYVSPDLPAGTAVTYYEPDYEIAPLGAALDDFMNRPLER